MRKKLIIGMAFCLSFLTGQVLAQEKGVHFETTLSWAQIRQKAKAENKYIFMDCFATWCGPCKQMDSEVYPDSTIGAFFYTHYVAVKVQFDSTKNDNANVIAWRKDARQIEKEDSVSAYPTLLFFSPEGQLVHKRVGYHPVRDFYGIAQDAINPDKQVYSLWMAYQQGQLLNNALPKLITALEKAEEKEKAKAVAKAYIHGYLLELPADSVLKEKNLGIIGRYTKYPGDPAFKFLWTHQTAPATKVLKDFLHSILFTIIYNEELAPKLWLDDKQKVRRAIDPDWSKFTFTISKKYDTYLAEETVNWAQLTWYKQKKDTAMLIKAKIAEIEKFETGGDGLLTDLGESKASSINNWMFNQFFTYSTDKVILNKAVQWQKQVVEKFPNEADYADTYANLNYKLGNKAAAIEWETKAMQLNADQVKKDNGQPDPGFGETLDKMKAGVPTWPTSADTQAN